MNPAVTQYAPLIGRILIAQIFLASGFGKIMGFTQTAAAIAGKGLPMAEVLVVLSIVIEIGAGLMILLGWKARIGAILLFLWMIPVSWAFHNYWTMTGMEAYINKIMFQKNLAMMGAMLYILAFGSGPYSVKKD